MYKTQTVIFVFILSFFFYITIITSHTLFSTTTEIENKEERNCLDQQEEGINTVESSMKVARRIRQIKRIYSAKMTPEGDGAKVKRSIGSYGLDYVDPFLMLDEFYVSKPAGFPNHPHRGFETVTYMLDGQFQHEDNKGHKGVIGPGDLQWMTAGRGLIHSEMPLGEGVNHGLQLWINLAAKDKMVDPQYQELTASEVPQASQDKVSVKIIAGKSMGKEAVVRTRTPAYYLDFTFQGAGEYDQEIPEDFAGFLYVLNGNGIFGDETEGESKEAAPGDCVLLQEEGSVVRMKNKDKEKEMRVVLIMGKPLKERVARRGPFVMSTDQELQQAFTDFYAGEFA